MVEFNLDDEQSKRLEEAMKRISGKSEEIVNKVLETKGTKIMIQKIIGFMPQSKLNTRHAKQSNPLKFRMQNLGFEVVPKGGASNKPGSFGYLVFPDQGRGIRNPNAQQFFLRGATSANELILQELIATLEEEHTKIIGG